MLAAGEVRSDDLSEVMAAVDLGSNSFHMIVAKLHHGQFAIIDRLREMVRLAAGLRRDGTLDESSQERALECLRRFGQRLHDMHANRVRVVGTNTLRKAREADRFLLRAEEALGHPVEVISGIEEARLIYSGVYHHGHSDSDPRLVVDIGGGSTELIVGSGRDPLHLESLSLGCVRATKEYFSDGELSARNFRRARLSIRLGLNPVAAIFQRIGWVNAIGASGTIRATLTIAHELGLSDTTLTHDAIETIIERMIAARRIDDLALPGLGPDRQPVFPGGVAILAEVVNTLQIRELKTSDGALKEGLLYEMLGAVERGDVRERTIQAVERRFHVDAEQASRVDATAGLLLGLVAKDWGLEDPHYARVLHWAARLHEIGLDIAHSRYHDHGGYLLENADLPGFALLEQRLVATLVRYHRRKLFDFTLAHLQERWRTPAMRLIVILRLAVLLNRARSPVEVPSVRLEASARGLKIGFPQDWFDGHPLTEADLLQEQAWLAAEGFDLVLANARAAEAV